MSVYDRDGEETDSSPLLGASLRSEAAPAATGPAATKASETDTAMQDSMVLDVSPPLHALFLSCPLRMKVSPKVMVQAMSSGCAQ